MEKKPHHFQKLPWYQVQTQGLKDKGQFDNTRIQVIIVGKNPSLLELLPTFEVH